MPQAVNVKPEDKAVKGSEAAANELPVADGTSSGADDTPVSEEEAKTYSEEDFQAEVQTQVQSRSDKLLAPLREDLKNAKKEMAILKLQLSDKQEDSAIARLEKAESTEYENTPEVRDFQEARQDLKAAIRSHRAKVAEIEEREADLTKREKTLAVTVMAAELGLPSDSPHLAELNDAETDRERQAIIRAIKAEVAKPTRAKKPKPDGGGNTAPGGRDTSALSAREKIRLGIAERAKKEH